MNLNRFKKGYTGTNPERGLRSLAGAVKADKHIDNPGAVRVKGRYIPRDTDRIGHFFGMMGYIHAWLYVILLPCSIYADSHSVIFSPMAVFMVGMFVVHGCAIIADGLRHTEAPWARKGIKIFWIATLTLAAFGGILSMF
ncbi:MAG: hypothetical protein AB8F34_08675 [Akkermansiaceae bacterium]